MPTSDSRRHKGSAPCSASAEAAQLLVLFYFTLSHKPNENQICSAPKWQPTPVFLPGESQGWGAWWAAVYGVAQSRTRLRQLSS